MEASLQKRSAFCFNTRGNDGDDLTESTAEINRDSVFFHKLFVVARYTTVSYGDSVGIGLLMRTISAEEAAVPLLFFPHITHTIWSTTVKSQREEND